jgi:anthranilate synthase/aminodeoxychorismate synthase-like glutamine amidotransferase
MTKVFLLDNHDSFTHNLAALIRKSGSVSLTINTPEQTELSSLSSFDKIVFSPGPGLPSEFPLMGEILDRYKQSKSILGVCLGHQFIGEYFGAKLHPQQAVSHGRLKKLHVVHKESKLYVGVPDRSEVGLYHSWYVDNNALPSCFRVTAQCNDEVIMSLEHKEFDIQSVQFHPESFITQYGQTMVSNWLNL